MAKKKQRQRQWEFRVSKDYWCGYDVECLLRSYGIAINKRVACLSVEPQFILISVDECKANFAEYVLCRAGVEILGKPYNKDNLKFFPDNGSNGSLLPGGGGGIRKDLITSAVDFVAPLFGAKVGRHHERHGLPVESRARPKKSNKKAQAKNAGSWWESISKALEL